MSETFSPLACFPAEGLMKPILEQTETDHVSPRMLDLRFVMGWRHFGQKFFRYNFALHEGVLCGVVPLRLRLERFVPSKSQRRILRRNEDLTTRWVSPRHNAEYDAIFDRHRVRFRDNVPESLRDFLSESPANVPCPNQALEVRLGDRLLAVSFMDIGVESASSVYAAFDPEFGARGLGILTLLLEIECARQMGKKFHYLGYAYTVPSVYDYKKRFAGVEGYDWENRWTPLPPDFTWSREISPDDSASGG